MIYACILAIEDESDREFMEGLFVQYERLMYSEIRKILKNAQDIEDVFQISLEKMIDKLQILRSRSRDQRVNYIISICKNTAISHLRSQNRAHNYMLDENWDSFHDEESVFQVEEIILTRIDTETLKKNWHRLDERSRLLLEDRYILEMTDEELAEEFHMKPSSVRMALSRARQNAYRILKNKIEAED